MESVAVYSRLVQYRDTGVHLHTDVLPVQLSGTGRISRVVLLRQGIRDQMHQYRREVELCRHYLSTVRQTRLASSELGTPSLLELVVRLGW
jgi:hypothetical protein